VLELPIAAGRDFEHTDHLVVPNAPLRLVLSDRMWTTMFGRDRGVVGQSIRFAENPYIETTIVGVAGPQADYPNGIDFWFAMQFPPDATPHILDGVLRLKPGISTDRLRAEMSVVMRGLARDVPGSDAGREYAVEPLVNAIVGDVRSTLLIIFGATALLLLLAAVNVTNLLLARGTARTREIAVRSALGASRSRIVRQLLTEAMVLAAIGATIGFALAIIGVRLLLALGAAKLPRLETVPFDANVLLFTIAALVVSGFAMGTAPAWRLGRSDIRSLVIESGRGTAGSRATSRTMGTMIVAEIAMAITLVAGAGWLVQSFARLRATDPGFVAAGRLVADVRATRSFTSLEQSNAWTRALLDRLRAAPGVRAVGATSTFPLTADRDSMLPIEFQGQHTAPEHSPAARARTATPEFFDAMGMQISPGRAFTDDDRGDTERVTIVNRTFVRRYLPDRNPLDVQFIFGYPTPDPKLVFRIVGVVQDARYKSLAEEPEPTFYLPPTQFFVTRRQAVVIATRTADPTIAVPAVRAQLKDLDAETAIEYESARDLVASTLSRQQLGMTLMVLFGATALALAAVGVYGVIAYAAALRRGEVATRIALGAGAGDVFMLIAGQGQRLAIGGTIVGLATSYAGGRLVATSVYAMRASDPVVLATAVALVVLIAAIATVVPALRAMRVDPAQVLRQ